MRWLMAATLRILCVGTVFAGAAQAACPSNVAGLHPLFQPASFGPRAVANTPEGNLRLSFVGHATFFIETPDGVGIATDYNGYIRPQRLPDIVTMNFSHSTHFTDNVPPEVKFVLRGWDQAGGIARHDVRLKDARVRSIPTNLVEMSRRRNDNSIFVVEAAGICVAHLGHLHHALSREHLADLGPIDVVLAPIDGRFTMSHTELIDVLKAIKPLLIVPMHYFGTDVELFTGAVSKDWPVKSQPERTILLNLRDLPKTTEVWFLRGGGY